MTSNEYPQFGRLKEAKHFFKVSGSTLWNWAKNRPGFPKPIKTGPRVTVWPIAQIAVFLGLVKADIK